MRHTSTLLLCVGLWACSQEQKVEYADEGEETKTETPEAARKTFTYNTEVNDKGLSLADATEYKISLRSCASNNNADITEANPYLELYEFDRGCLAKLTEFKLNGKTYTPKAGSTFTNWGNGDVATFEVASANPADELRVEVLSTIPSAVVANGAIHYQFSEITKGTDQNVPEAEVRVSATVAVDGQASPQFVIKNIYFVGVNADGNGEFRFQLECDGVDITGNGANRKCQDVRFDTMGMLLAEDPGTPTLDQTALDTLWNAGAPKNLDMNTQVFDPGAGSPALPHGGFITATSGDPAVMVMGGVKPLADHRNMVFILKSGPSYTYYKVVVDAITQDNSH